MKTISSLGEFGLINAIKHRCVKNDRVIVSIGDDTAVLKYTHDKYQLLTTDMMAEDVHFKRNTPASSIGHKALASNISDIAAMGGIGSFAVVSLGLPATLPVRWVKDFYSGANKIAQECGVSIVGGDTIKSQHIIVNVALLGEVEKKYLVTRDTARPKDFIFVTGSLGGSFQSGRHLNFIPRVEQARFLVKYFKPSAMMDISDGLAGDLNHILRASHVGAQLFYDQIPRHQGVTLQHALSDGEDYELLFTLSPDKVKRLMQWQLKNKRWFFYHIGEIVKDRTCLLKQHSFEHFK